MPSAAASTAARRVKKDVPGRELTVMTHGAVAASAHRPGTVVEVVVVATVVVVVGGFCGMVVGVTVVVVLVVVVVEVVVLDVVVLVVVVLVVVVVDVVVVVVVVGHVHSFG